jgi:hypothetical protein
MSGASDSGHLLGAAGLGLIGGIALAGVLAVFVFNSFVDIDQGADQGAPKVVERLGGPEIKAGVTTQPDKPTMIELQRPGASGEPRLTARNVIGSLNEPIRLDIAISNPAHAEDSLVSIKGLPKDARLSTGIDVGSGQWLLPPARLKNLTLSLPQGATGAFTLVVQLLKDDAQTSLSDPISFTLSVGARSASLPTVRDAGTGTTGKVDEPSQETDFLTQMLIRDGNRHMRDGEILAARRLYEQAALSGSPEAALAMGRSYDPTYFERLNVKTGKPDPTQAFEWYKKALDGGLSTARIKIDALKQWLQR